MSRESFHEQSSWQRLRPLTPTTQSGEGPNIETKDILGCFRSTRKWDEVLVFTLGYQRPAALMRLRNLEPLARNSVSKERTDPLKKFKLRDNR